MMTLGETFPESVHYILKSISAFRFHIHIQTSESLIMPKEPLLYQTVILFNEHNSYSLMCPHLNRKYIKTPLRLDRSADAQCSKFMFINGTFDIFSS